MFITIVIIIGLLLMIVPISQIIQSKNEEDVFLHFQNLHKETLKKFGNARIDVNIPPKKQEEYTMYLFVIISSEAGKMAVGDKEFLFKDIKDYDYSEEATGGTATTNTNVGSAIGRGAAGALVGGGVGALIGAGTAKKETIITPGIKKREITIYLNNLQCPYVCYATVIAEDARLVLGALKCIL